MITDFCNCTNSSCQCEHDYNNPNSPHDAAYGEWRGDVFQELVDAGYVKEANDFWSCAGGDAAYIVPQSSHVSDDVKGVYACSEHPDQHQAKAVKLTCHLRICPDCAARASSRFLYRYVDYINDLVENNRNPRLRLRHIVLTTPIELTDAHAPDEFNRLFGLVVSVFDRVLDNGWRKNQGLLAAAEFGTHGHKLHFHILHFGQYIPHDKLTEAWKDVTDSLCEVTFVKGIKRELDAIKDAISEIVKYTTKFWSSENGEVIRLDPALIPVLLEVLKGSRRVRSYGVFYNIDVPEKQSTCPDCGSPLIHLSSIEWNIFIDTGWLPDEQKQHLSSDIGNKSPPDALNGDRASPPQPKESSPPTRQLLLNDAFGPRSRTYSYS